MGILLHQLIPDLRDWNVTILATDINPRFLCKAAKGSADVVVVFRIVSCRGGSRNITSG